MCTAQLPCCQDGLRDTVPDKTHFSAICCAIGTCHLYVSDAVRRNEVDACFVAIVFPSRSMPPACLCVACSVFSRNLSHVSRFYLTYFVYV